MSTEIEVRKRRKLPHWEADGATYFVTFRLADSLPQQALRAIKREREDIVKTARQQGRALSHDELQRLDHLFSKRMNDYLDAGAGACHMANEAIGELVANALRHCEGNRYELFAWSVMPNHVHVLFNAYPDHGLGQTVPSWKNFTARKANALLGTEGQFGAREYYDHLIRDDDELVRSVVSIILRGLTSKAGSWCGFTHNLDSKTDERAALECGATSGG